jgi:hypothetical protein
MKKIKQFLLASIICLNFIHLMGSCSGFKNQDQKYIMTTTDSLWIEFAKAMESNNIDFLIDNSLDSITCYDCNIGTDNQKIYFDSQFIFRNHMDKIMHLKSLTDKEFSSYHDDNIIQISYTIKASQAPEGAYNLIFTFIKKGKRFLFQGMLVT